MNKTCKEGEELNPITGRCRKVCPPGKVRNAKGNCVKTAKKTVKACKHNEEINPKTGRCRKVCPAGTVRNNVTGKCIKNKQEKHRFEKEIYGTKLIYAATIGNYNMAKSRINKDDVNAYMSEKNGEILTTALTQAAINGNIKIIELLLDNGADVNKYEYDYDYYERRSALHNACQINRSDIAELLLKHGADVDTFTNHDHTYKGTPLHQAAMYDNLECAFVLLMYGANVSRIDDEGRTPLDLAIENNSKNVAKLIENWNTLKALPILQELKHNGAPVYYLMDAESIIDLFEYIGKK